MKLCITTLSENAVAGLDLLGEWGLSTLIETDEVSILFDVGQSISSAHNAEALDIDLRKVNKIVLSHGHFDHTGGLRRILRKIKGEVEIIAHPDVWAAKYRCHEGQTDRKVGIPFTRGELENLGAHFNLTRKPVKITDSIMTTGEIPLTTDFEEIDADMFVKVAGHWQPDKLLDDQALIIRTGSGLVVILGCAHRGMINTLYRARNLTGVETIHAVLGGSHLHKASEERVWATIAALRSMGVQKLGLTHCTGEAVVSLLAQEFGENFFYNHAGTRFDLLGE